MLRTKPSAAVLVVVLLVGATAAACSAPPSTARPPATPPVSTAPKARHDPPVPLPSSMAALGDSITQAYDATPTKHPLTVQPQWSWSTGNAGATIVDSQYERLLRAGDASLRSPGRTANFSVPGARMKALPGQAEKAVAMKARYVTILMGANDLCTSTLSAMTPVAAFQAAFTSAMTELQKIQGVHIFVASIPDLYYLWQLLHGNADAHGIWQLGICPSMLSTKDTNAQRQQVLSREKEDNAVLSAVCGKFPDCRFDKDAVFDYRFSPRQVSSFDYFHPSISGQDVLAALTWAESFWPKRP